MLDTSCDRIDASVFEYDTPAVDSSSLTPSSLKHSGYLCNYLVGSAAVILTGDWQVLLGLRADNDTWSLFGGKAEPQESMAEACARETGEEINLVLPATRYVHLDIREAYSAQQQRCLTAYQYAVVSAEERATVMNLEPKKCLELRWFAISDLPMNIWQDGHEMILRARERLMRNGRSTDYVL